SSYQAQINDILKISAEKIYQSQEVTEKEIAGHKIISTLLDAFTEAAEKKFTGTTSNFDQLILRAMLPETKIETRPVYEWLLDICCAIASLTDGNAIRHYKKIQGATFDFG